MRKLIVLTLVSVLVLGIHIAKAQSLEVVLNKHFKAVGQDKLVSAQTFFMKAKISQMGMELPMEMRMERPNKFRVETDMQGQKMIQAYNGEKGWMIAPWVSSEPQDLTGEQLKQAMSQADFEGELYNYEAKGHSADLVGKVNADGIEAYKIKLTTEDGSVKSYFIDAKTNLIIKVKAKVSAMGQELDVEQKLSNYKDFGGVFMATKMESITTMGNMSIMIEDFKVNQKFESAIFERPAK